MDKFSIVFLFLFIFFLPIFSFLICLAARKRYKNYPLFSFWISNIGEKRQKSHLIFSINLFIFGVLEVCFSFFLLKFLPAVFTSKIAGFFFALAGILAIGIVFFPMDKKPKSHERISTALFIAIFLAFAFVGYPLAVSKGPIILLILDFLILAFSILLSYSFFVLKSRYGSKELKNLAKVRRSESSLVLRAVSYWEWLVFICLVAWLLSEAAFLLSRLT